MFAGLYMGKIRNAIPVKLFVGMLSADASLFNACAEILRVEYGPVDLESDVLDWNKTDYYREEMGSGLLRKFIFFNRLATDPTLLSDVKVFTNGIENMYSENHGIQVRRKINIDPGYITEAKVILASTKDYAHRIYIGRDIYAEVTLQYRMRGRTFIAIDHTYPDFKTPETLSLFNKARAKLKESLRNNGDQCRTES